MGGEVGEKNLGLLTYRTIIGLSGPTIDPATRQVRSDGYRHSCQIHLESNSVPRCLGKSRRRLYLSETCHLP